MAFCEDKNLVFISAASNDVLAFDIDVISFPPSYNTDDFLCLTILSPLCLDFGESRSINRAR